MQEGVDPYRQLLDHIDEIVYQVEGDTLAGTVRFVSKQIEEILGYRAEEFFQDSNLWLRLIHPEDVDGVSASTRQIIASREKGVRVYRLRHKGRGEYLWFEDKVVPQVDAQGRVTGIWGVARDITRRRQAEEAREQAERALEEHRSMLVRTDRLRFLGQMAAGMAHELNQPLQGVRGQAEHLLIGMDRGWKPQKTQWQEKLRSIIAQADRMAHIIEHLRVFACEAGHPVQRLVQVGEVARAACGLVETQFRSRGVEIGLDLEAGLPRVSANPFSLEEVILNLLTNARDAVEERLQAGTTFSSPQISVRTRAEGEGAEQRVRIEVIDQGTGIPEAVLDQVFDPFFTTKSPDRGTGLGLSIVKALVEEIGGRIAIQSTMGQGTQVSLSLPAASPPQES